MSGWQRHSVARCAGLVKDVQAQLGQRDAAVRARLQAIERERRDVLTQPLPPAGSPGGQA